MYMLNFYFQKAPIKIVFLPSKLLSHHMFHTRGSISMPCWPTRWGGFLFLRPGSVLAGFFASLWGLLLGVYRAHKKTMRPMMTANARVPRRIAHQYFLTVSFRPVKNNKNTIIIASNLLLLRECYALCITYMTKSLRTIRYDVPSNLFISLYHRGSITKCFRMLLLTCNPALLGSSPPACLAGFVIGCLEINSLIT